MENQSRIDLTSHLAELQTELLERLSVALIAIGGLAAWYTTSLNPFPGAACLTFLGLMALGFFARIIHEKHPALARALILVGVFTAWGSALLHWADPWMPFFCLPLIFISGLLFEKGEWAAGLLSFGGLLALNLTGMRGYPTGVLAAVISLTVITAWLAMHLLYTSIFWYRAMLKQSDTLLKETREHRGELTRALKSLQLANDLQRRTEQELILARLKAEDARRVKEQFAASVSHELRTPLSLILGFSEVMYQTPEAYGDLAWPPTLRRDISQIFHSSRHLLSMIDDILNLSKFEIAGFSLNLEATPLGPFLQDAAAISEDLLRGRPVRFETDFEANLPLVEIDRTRIRQVLLNLISNASRFTETGSIRVKAYTYEAEVIISVADTGPGIPADQLDLIFEEFYQVNYNALRSKGGTGLGLAICKNFVEAHGGRIWVESQSGAGSTFFFTIPRSQPPLLGAVMDVDRQKIKPPAAPVLLVHGADASVAALLRRYMPGFDLALLDERSDLEAAVTLHHPAAILWNSPPDAAPVQPPELPVSTPFLQCSIPNLAWLADSLGVQACLSKPIDPQKLVREIRKNANARDILVIDDDRGFIQLVERELQAYLPDQTFAIRRAYDGRQGLQSMLDQPPDLVLLDLYMPEMDGYHVIETMKANPALRDLPVLVLTANNYPDTGSEFEASQLCISRSGGLRVVEVVNYLAALMGVIKNTRQPGELALP